MKLSILRLWVTLTFIYAVLGCEKCVQFPIVSNTKMFPSCIVYYIALHAFIDLFSALCIAFGTYLPPYLTTPYSAGT